VGSSERAGKQRPAHRLLAFLPPRGARFEGSVGRLLGVASVVGYGGIDASNKQCSSGDAPLSLLPKVSSVDLVFDVSDVFSAQLDIPPMSQRRMQQALPGLIEERMLTDAADCHLAYQIESAERNPTPVALAAIDRATLTGVLEAAADAHVRPCRAYSALYSIPAPAAGTLSVRFTRGRGTVRTAEHAGFAFDLAQGAPAALAVAVQQLKIKRIRVYGGDARKLLRFLVPLGVEVINPKRDFNPASIAQAVNLLQGPFAPTGRFGIRAALVDSGQWKPLLVWATVLLGIAAVGLNAYRFRLEAESRALRAAMQMAFRDAFPSEPVVEPTAQAQRHLRQLRARAGQPSPDDFSQLNAQAAHLLSGAPVGALAGVEYRDAALTLKLKAGVGNSAAFQNALQAEAVQQGLNVRFDPDGSARIVPANP
jgi:general secretion pathway protein L